MDEDGHPEATSLTSSDVKVKLNGTTETPPALQPPSVRFPSCRLIVMFMSFFAFLNIYCLRVNLSVAIVAMVNTSYTNELERMAKLLDGNDTVVVDEVVCTKENNETTKHVEADSGEFNWDTKRQGIILAAFFYGYITTQIIGGILAQKFGSKYLLLFGVFWTALLTLLTPVLTVAGDFPLLVAVRVLEGVGEGVTYPAMHAMLSRWAPPLERSKMVTTTYAGAQMGTVLTMPISGILCQYVGWPSVFYVFGALGMVWSVMWFFLIFDTPALHPRIDQKEREYIETSLGNKANEKGSLRTPWLAIFKSLPVYAVIVGHFANNWGYYTLLTCLPQYLKHILHFDIKSNGFLSGLPYLAMWAMLVFSGLAADWLRARNCMSTTVVRKLLTTIGFVIPAICLICTGYVDCNAPLAVSLIVIAVGTSGISMAGWGVNHLDLAPPYAGTLMGLTNMAGTIPGFVGPSVVGALTYRNQTREAWRGVFYISAAVYAFGTIFYLIFGTGEKQPWGVLQESANETQGEQMKDMKKKQPLLTSEDEKSANGMKI